MVTHGRTYDNASNLAKVFLQKIITKYEGTRLGRQEIEAELIDGEILHRVPMRNQCPGHGPDVRRDIGGNPKTRRFVHVPVKDDCHGTHT